MTPGNVPVGVFGGVPGDLGVGAGVGAGAAAPGSLTMIVAGSGAFGFPPDATSPGVAPPLGGTASPPSTSPDGDPSITTSAPGVVVVSPRAGAGGGAARRSAVSPSRAPADDVAWADETNESGARPRASPPPPARRSSTLHAAATSTASATNVGAIDVAR